MIWKNRPTIEQLNQMSENTMAGHIGIRFTNVDDDSLQATMPVNSHTRQPYGLLHGGASVALAETLGSVAAFFCSDFAEGKRPVGLEINANHVKSATEGQVTGTARPIHLGRSTQVWEIRIENERKELITISRLTVAMVKT